MQLRGLLVLLAVLVALNALGASGDDGNPMLPYDNMVGNVIFNIFVIGAIVLFVGALALACIGVTAAVIVPPLLIGASVVLVGLAFCANVVIVPIYAVLKMVKFLGKSGNVLARFFRALLGLVFLAFVGLFFIGYCVA
jgi:hypothetical protein